MKGANHPIQRANLFGHPTAVVGHMPFPGHRTCAECWPSLAPPWVPLPDHAEPLSGFVAVQPRNPRAILRRATKCVACCAYTNEPCQWSLCPQRDRA